MAVQIKNCTECSESMVLARNMWVCGSCGTVEVCTTKGPKHSKELSQLMCGKATKAKRDW